MPFTRRSKPTTPTTTRTPKDPPPRRRTGRLLPALVGAGLLALAPGAAAGQAAPPDPVAQPADRYVVIDGLRLHYRAWGRPEAPPLVILHGLTGHAWEFDGVAAALADRYYVLALNQRGHGASDWADAYAPAVMADDLAAFLDALGLGRVRLVGHSMGGVNAWWFAARYPARVERLAILDIDPAILASAEALQWWEGHLANYAAARYSRAEDAVAAYLARYRGTQEQALRAYARNNVVQQADGRWAWRFDAAHLFQWMERAADAEAHWTRLRRLQCPTLLLRGADSPFTDAAVMARMAAAIPAARFAEVAGAAHDLHIDQPAALLAHLRPFLAAP